jgi:hypothetical protein
MKWDYNRYLIGKKVEFFTNGELGKPLSGVADYALDAEMGCATRSPTGRRSISRPSATSSVAPDADLNKTRYTAGFGVAW